MRITCQTLLILLHILLFVEGYQWRSINLNPNPLKFNRILQLPHDKLYCHEDKVYLSHKTDTRKDFDIVSKYMEVVHVKTFAFTRTISQLAIALGVSMMSISELPDVVFAREDDITIMNSDIETDDVEILNPIDEVSEFLNFGKKLKNNQINKERASAAEKEQLRKGKYSTILILYLSKYCYDLK